MKEMEWRLQYAPKGYHVVKEHICFETIERARIPSYVIENCVDRLLRMLSREVGDVSATDVFTRLTVFPKQIGENVNHLDPLVPRFGIEIEARFPL